MTPRMIAVLAALLLVLRVASARVALLPGLPVPVTIPLGAVLVPVVLVLIAAGVWLIRRKAREFRSCPHPHSAWATG